MADPKNFLNETVHAFSDRAINAAKAGRLANAEPLLRSLHRVMIASRGVAEILAIQQANELQETFYLDRDPGQPMEPPLSRATTGALLGLAQFACESISEQVEDLSHWIDKYGLKEPQ
ncbi:hypothetical protein ACQUFY_16810 [Robbsia andropogonis]|uniref:hypothetical protein n=1 Tax=Robbsia andropogonis TaxID=28092 RepID=UPI003D1C2D61